MKLARTLCPPFGRCHRGPGAAARALCTGGSSRSSSSSGSSGSTLDQAELNKFSSLASEWWDPSSRAGVALLHRMNPTRVRYIRRVLRAGAAADATAAAAPLHGLRLLDVGCGGGILAESLARLGATVTAIDPAAANVAAARAHAAHDPRTRGITYEACAIEEHARALAGTGTGTGTGDGDGGAAPYDAVVALEVIEHVPPSARGVFLESIARVLKPGGTLVLSTLNRTHKAFALAVFGAERVAGLLPPGTHDWDRFVTPEEADAALAAVGLEVQDVSGILFRPSLSAGLGLDFELDDSDIDVNYILHATKS